VDQRREAGVAGRQPPGASRPYGSARSSGARECVAEAAASMDGAFRVDQLTAAVRRLRPATGTATVYRAVAALEASGWLERVGERDGTALFARCHASDHHHHLVCTGCGATVPTACPLDERVSRSAVEAGFLMTAHEVRLYGLCAQCAEGPGAPHDGATA
jgi:Fur family ferric uptake transcriptional regulator